MTIKVLGIEQSLTALLHQLDSSSRVFYTRLGDGDIFLATGKRDSIHRHSPELQKEIIDTINISDQRFLKGVSSNYPLEPGMADGLFAPFPYNEDLEARIKSVITTDETEFFNPVLFQYLITFKHQVFNGFIDEFVYDKRKMFIGCREKAKMEMLFGKIDRYVQIPERDAYYSIDKWWPEVEAGIYDCEVCIPAGGSATKVINRRLWDMGVDIHSFDVGSLVDVFEDTPTRTWIKLKGHEINKRYVFDNAGNMRDDEGGDILDPKDTNVAPYVNIDSPQINIHVPFEPGNLARAYNNVMKKASYDEWVLFLDHDAMILRSDWYNLLVDVIVRHGKNAGWITCVTNEIWCDDQLCMDSPRDENGESLMDMEAHCNYSNKRVEEYGDSVKPFSKTSNKPLGNVFSGIMILTNKKAWEDAGGFEEEEKVVEHNFLGNQVRFRTNKFLGVDNDYFMRLVAEGYEPLVVSGLYAYHLRSKKSMLKVADKGNIMRLISSAADEQPVQKPKKKGKKNKKKKKNKNKQTNKNKSLRPDKNGIKNLARKNPKPQSISVCIMTRASKLEDPDLNLRRCLKSVKPFADEIIVLNTRTEDDPPDNFDAICDEFECKKYYRPWDNHFSKSRNESIRYCTKDWTFMIDSDEEIAGFHGKAEDFKRWLSLVPDSVRSLKFTLINMANGKRGAQFNPPKMFRRGTIKYEKSVHNIPIFFGPAIYCDQIEFIHYGYDISPDGKQAKFERSSSLLYKRLETDPEDYECHFYLSQLYGQNNNIEKQLEHADKYLKHRYELKHIKFDNSIFYSSLRANLQIGKFDRAREWLDLGLEELPDDLDLLLAATEMSIMAKDRDSVLKNATAFVANYATWEDLRNQGKNSHFVHSYIPEAYAFCQLHIAHIKLSEGRASFESVMKTLPMTNENFHRKMETDINRIVTALDLEPLLNIVKKPLQKVA